MSKVINYLRENGPSPLRDLPSEPSYTDRQNAINIIKWRFGGLGAVQVRGGMGNAVYIAYLRDHHDRRDVVEAWIQANERVLEKNEKSALYNAVTHKADKEWLPPLREAWEDRGWPKVTERQRNSTGGTSPGTCPLCGEDYNHSFPRHRRSECDA